MRVRLTFPMTLSLPLLVGLLVNTGVSAGGGKPMPDERYRTTVPYAGIGRDAHIVIAVRLNAKRTARLGVDTGSSSSYISVECVKSLGLETYEVNETDGKPATSSSRKGALAMAVKIPRLEIGDLPFDGVPFRVLAEKRLPAADISRFNSEPLDGILGLNVLRLFAIMLDPFRREVTFEYPGGLDDKGLLRLGMDRAKRTEFTMDNQFATISVRLNEGVEEAMVLDTGCEHSTISNRTARLLRLKPSGSPIDQRSMYGDFEVARAKLQRAESGSISIDGPDWFYALNDDKRLPPRIGQDVFTAYRTLFDFPVRKLYLAPPSFFK